MPPLPSSTRACLFDLDGVLTDTAALHALAWKEAFDGYLEDAPGAPDSPIDSTSPYRPFDSGFDYRMFVDGKRRADGVAAFFASRELDVPIADQLQVAADKTTMFERLVQSRGLDVYPDVIGYLEYLRDAKIHRAVVSASEHCQALVEAAGIASHFETRVDGQRAAAEGLAGKPAPDTYLAAAADLRISPAECAVFEDAISGLEAGRAGGFGTVVGVNRKGLDPQPFIDAGATFVVSSFDELQVD